MDAYGLAKSGPAGGAAAMFFFNLGATHLWDVDEAIFSQAAKEMYERGDATTPYFNGQIFPDKPAMMYWLMMSAYEVFGPTEFAARFWSAVFGVGSVLLTYRIGRLIFSPAWLSGPAMLATCVVSTSSPGPPPDCFDLLLLAGGIGLRIRHSQVGCRRRLTSARRQGWPNDVRTFWATWA
jgi:hypothetical protein